MAKAVNAAPEVDEVVVLVTAYTSTLAEANAAPKQARARGEVMSDDDFDRILDALNGPYMDRIKAGLPPARTQAGAIMALELALKDIQDGNGSDFTESLVVAALGYFKPVQAAN